MATTKINTKTLFDLDAFLADETQHNAEFAVSKYTGLHSKTSMTTDDLSQMFEEDGGASIDTNGNLVFEFDTNKTLTVTGYYKANGKGKFNLLVGRDYDADDGPNAYVNILEAGIVNNIVTYDIANETIYDAEKDKVKTYSVTGTNFNDTFNFSGFQAEDKEEDAYIKKGFTVKGGEGKNEFEGSVLADNYTGGANDDAVVGSAGNDTYSLGGGVNTAEYNIVEGAFGTDTYKLTKNSSVTLNDFGVEEEAQLEKYVSGNNLVIDAYAQATTTFTKTSTGFAEETANKVYTKVANEAVTVKTDVLQISVETVDGDGHITAGSYFAANGRQEALTEDMLNAINLLDDVQWAANKEYRLEGTTTEVLSVLEESENGQFTDGVVSAGAYYIKETKEYTFAQNEQVWQWVDAGNDTLSYETNKVVANTVVSATLSDHKVDAKYNATTDKPTDYQTAYYLKTTTVSDYDGENWNVDAEKTTYEASKTNTAVADKYLEINTNVADTRRYEITDISSMTEAERTAELTKYDADGRVYNTDLTKMGSTVFQNAAASGATVAIENDALTGDEAVAFNHIAVPTKGTNVTGTAYGDIVDLNEEDDGFTVKTLAGNDVVTSSQGDDTLTLGAGFNELTHTAGDDTVNLTKGEVLGVTNEFHHYEIVKNDVIAYDAEDETAGSVTFKNFAKGNTGATVIVNALDEEANLAEEARYKVELSDDLTKFTSPYLGATVTVDEEGTENALTVDLSKTQFANIVTLTGAEGKVTVKGGSAQDVVVDGEGNGTYTLGYTVDADGDDELDANTLTYGGGDDVVNLTAKKTGKVDGEVVTLAQEKTAIDMTQVDYYADTVLKVVKNDVVATALNADEEIIGTVTIKNFAAKDVGAIVTVNEQDLAEYNYKTTWDEDVVNTTKSFTGSRLNDVVDATAYTNGLIPTATTKGVTVDLKDGVNQFTGSAHADTVKAGAGADAVIATAGNDSYALGKGANTAAYTFENGENYHKDTYTLVNDSSLDITVTDANTIVYSKSGNDIVATATTDNGGSANIVLKNYATGKVDADVTVNTTESIWAQEINIEATSATTTGTFGNDVISSDRKSNTFVESYKFTFNEQGVPNGVLFGENTITSDNTNADTIKVTAFDKASAKEAKVSAYQLDYGIDNIAQDEEGFVSATVSMDLGDNMGIDYTGNLNKGLNFVDATGAKWNVFSDAVAVELDDESELDDFGDLSANKQTKSVNNIAIMEGTELTDSKKNDIIIGKSAGTKFNYTAGKDLYSSEVVNSDDTYNATLDKKTTLIVSDTEGSNELNFNLGTNSDFSIFFDVDDNGVGGNLAILNESSFYGSNGKAIVKSAKALTGNFAAGSIVLDGAIDENGQVAGFTLNANGVDVTDVVSGAINGIAENVAAWLATKDDYSSAIDVLENGSSADVQTLMAFYNPAV